MAFSLVLLLFFSQNSQFKRTSYYRYHVLNCLIVLHQRPSVVTSLHTFHLAVSTKMSFGACASEAVVVTRCTIITRIAIARRLSRQKLLH